MNNYYDQQSRIDIYLGKIKKQIQLARLGGQQRKNRAKSLMIDPLIVLRPFKTVALPSDMNLSTYQHSMDMRSNVSGVSCRETPKSKAFQLKKLSLCVVTPQPRRQQNKTEGSTPRNVKPLVRNLKQTKSRGLTAWSVDSFQSISL